MEDSSQEIKKLKVLMVLDSTFPPDLRVRKEFTALIEAGYEISLVCYRKKGQARTETVLGCKIIRSKKVVTQKLKGLVDIYNALFFINPILSRTLNDLKEKYDIIHVHDLPPSNTALRYGRKKGMKTVLDLHENYPEAIKVWFVWRKGFLIRLKNRIFFNYTRWFKREKNMVTNFDTTIAVVEEMKARLVDNHQLKDGDVSVISNTEPKDIFTENLNLNKENKSNRIIYVGGIGSHRGLDTAVRGMAVLKAENTPFELIIVGSGSSDSVNYLKEIAIREDITDRVKFTGQLPFKEALSYMQTAFLNIIPHSSNGHTDNGIPHKLFQIMNSGYPLMVSSSAPLKRIVSGYQAGVIFEADNPKSFADKVVWANANRDLLKEYAKNAKDAVLKYGLNWETDAKKLVATYESLSN